jgi:hypothetical protein
MNRLRIGKLFKIRNKIQSLVNPVRAGLHSKVSHYSSLHPISFSDSRNYLIDAFRMHK